MLKRLVLLIKGVAYFLVLAFIAVFIWERLPFNRDQSLSENGSPTTRTISQPAGLKATPTLKKPAASPTRTEIPIHTVELRQAIKDGIVLFEAIGDGLEALDLILDSLSEEDIRVEVEPGTIFLPGNASTQSMVVRRGEMIDLPAGGRAQRELDVACANMHRGTPSSDDHFSIDLELSPSDLVDLLELAEFLEEEFRLQQFAIWTITDNPASNRYVRLGYFGTGSGPSEAEIERIYQLFLSAGIQTGKYRSLSAFPTPTPKPTPTIAPIDLGNCIPAAEITLAYTGQTVCAFGVVSHTYLGDGYTSLSFSKDRGSFYLLSYDIDLRAHAPGACVRVVGEVAEYMQAPMIVVGYKTELESCP